MVRYRRLFVTGGTFFLTLTLADRHASLLTDHITILRASFRKERKARPFEIEAIVVLPDHLHMLIALPPGDADFSTRVRMIKSGFTKGLLSSETVLPRSANVKHTVWQNRFWEHAVRDEQDFARHIDYIHHNPVKHGLVQHPIDWPFSSIHRYVRAGLLTEEWATENANPNPGTPVLS